MKSKRIKLSRELAFVLGMVIMPLAITLCTKAGLGLSMIAAPTYIISEKIPITYGQTEYIFQLLVLVVMSLIVGKFKPIYLTSFLSALVYGTILDFFIWCMSGFEVTALWLRILFFACGVVLTALGVAILMNTYLPPCAYDYLVREVVKERGIELKKVKLTNDGIYFVTAVLLTLLLHRRFIGITWGTLIIVAVNGHLISAFNKLLNSRIDFFTRFPKLEKIF